MASGQESAWPPCNRHVVAAESYGLADRLRHSCSNPNGWSRKCEVTASESVELTSQLTRWRVLSQGQWGYRDPAPTTMFSCCISGVSCTKWLQSSPCWAGVDVMSTTLGHRRSSFQLSTLMCINIKLILYTLCPQKSSTPNSWQLLSQFLTDFENSFTAGKVSKFPTKFV